MAGRPRKPHKLHVLHGTARADRYGASDELEIPNAPIGDAPDYVAEILEAKAEWDRLTGDTTYSQVLSPVFRSALIEYCILHARMIEDARGGEELKTTQRQLLSSLRMQLGITPASQSKVHIPKKQKPKSKWDKLG